MSNYSAWRKNNLREIKKTRGRFIAIMAIIALGVGFFSGLKITKTAMLNIADEYISEGSLFDYRLISTLGLDDEDVKSINSLEGVKSAEGCFSFDFLGKTVKTENDGESLTDVYKVFSLTENVNKPSLTAGRYPEAYNECIADAMIFSEDMLGDTIIISDENDEDTSERFKYREYKIVGLANTSYFLNMERGTSSLGDGSVNGFVIIPREGFNMDYYTDIYVTLEKGGEIYSDEYEEAVAEMEAPLNSLLEERADIRYSEIVSEAEALLAETELQNALSEIEDGRNEISEIEYPTVYVLDRSTNTGYVSFENDANIVEGISRVFPIFFFLVAALVCITTMTRMVDEQRTQIGTLKSMGYSNMKITMKFMTYSGSAALSGCILGYIVGSKLFPWAIWQVYGLLYNHFADIEFVVSPVLILSSLLASLLCSVGATWVACHAELVQMPAELIRPKTPKSGKRIWMEKIPFVWNRMKFLHKVSARNIFRFKKRMIMMLLGIGGCTALIVTGFGVSDSIINIASDQYDNIMKYDYTVSFEKPLSENEQEEFKENTSEMLSEAVFVCTDTKEADIKNGIREINIIATDDPGIQNIMGLTYEGETVPYPEDGKVIISNGIAEEAGISVGDTITIKLSDVESYEAEVSGIFRNYVWHYVLMTENTYEEITGEKAEYDSVLAVAQDKNRIYETSAELLNMESVSGVSVVNDIKTMVSDLLQNLNYIVGLVVVCALAFAFVVLYNLSNINVTERTREIATIKVLGFYPSETNSYVFRENIVLTLLGIFVGLPAGVLLHSYVMNNIDIEMVSFNIQIYPQTYVYATVITIVLAIVVDVLLQKKIQGISMTESLKSVE